MNRGRRTAPAGIDESASVVHGGSLARIERSIPRCRRCPELRAYCTRIARQKRPAYADWEYWGRPVPGFGDPLARIWIVGLAPAAHGGNRTGRVFTGDRSGDFLYAALHRAELANQPLSRARDDGLRLFDVYVSAALRCAPPANRPTPRQLRACSAWLDAEAATLAHLRVVLCLGAIAWSAALGVAKRAGLALPRPRPRFAHGAQLLLGGVHVLGCYHVSQQNTFTGKLTPEMLDLVLARARALSEVAPAGAAPASAGA